MEQHSIKYIQCGELQVAASCETQSRDILQVYYPSTILMYTQTGQINIKLDQELFTIAKGQFGLLRKYTEAGVFKTWGKDETGAKTYVFALTNEFIRKVIDRIELPKNSKPVSERYIGLPATKLLEGLIQSLIAYIDDGADLDAALVELKTQEALYALIKANPEVAGIFREFSMAERADMEKLMNNNFLYNIPLQTLAVQSGRSLSTFNREFKSIFNEAPHKWIRKKRVQFARSLMVSTHKMPSEVYLEAGFEDLSHFSRTFKSHFNITPSQFYQSLG